MGKTTKKIVIIALLAIIAMTGQGQTFTWRIEGTVANAAPTDTQMVMDAEKRSTITTQGKLAVGSRYRGGQDVQRTHGEVVRRTANGTLRICRERQLCAC